ncbi:MAG: endo-1,4-beta-xylanase, partial [Defluviitaleaceae bacterium]|nr:endo-1,4-beta-xylanase [Defluviitaleaceae bacterium]
MNRKKIFLFSILIFIFCACEKKFENEISRDETEIFRADEFSLANETERDEIKISHANEISRDETKNSHANEISRDETKNSHANEISRDEPAAFSFETDDDGFFARGAGTISRTNEAARSGDFSLKITGRTAQWHGIALDVTEISEPFGEYEFSMWVRPISGAANFQLSAEFIRANQPTWKHFNGAAVLARADEWTQIRGVLPFDDFDAVNVYIETQGSDFAEFFIDDVNFKNISPKYIFDTTQPKLFEAYEKFFLFGTAVVPRDLQGTRLEFIRHHFNTITAGNEMKPDALQRFAGIFTFGAADSIVEKTVGMNLIGHTLVWHMQSPAWKNRSGIIRDEAIFNLQSHIREVVTHFKGKAIAWDVVNEAFPSYVAPDENFSDWRKLLRETPWLDAVGSDYIELAFRAAHEADPDAKLIYNDYNLDSVGKREAVFHMIKELTERGVPIHGVGMQAHYDLTTKPSDVENSILRFAELGISVSISELDITAQNAAGLEEMPRHLELAQAILYAKLFKIFR